MALNSSLSPDDRDLLIRTIIPDAEGRTDDEIAAAARGIIGRVGQDGQSVSDVVLGRGNYPAWATSAPLNHPNNSDAYVRVARAITPAVQNDAGGESEAEFEKRLGLSSNPPPGVVKAPKLETQDEFEKRLGVGSAAPTEPAKAEQTAGPLAASSAFTGGWVRGIPIVGPSIDTGVQHAAAYMRSRMYGTPYEDELKAVQSYATGTAEAHPNLELAGNIGGSINALAPAMAAAPTLMGVSGPLLQRAVMGGVSGAGINALDQAVRSSGDPNAIDTGAIIGGAFGLGTPFAGRAIGAGANALMRTAIDPMTASLARRAAELGIPIRPPQMSSSPFVSKLDQMAGQLPGAVTPRLAAEQQGAVTRAVSRTFGENTDTLTPATMQAAKKRIGGEFKDVLSRMSIAPDDTLANDLGGIVHDASRFLRPDDANIIKNHLEDVFSKFSAGNGEIEGKAYQALVQKGSALDDSIKGTGPEKNYAMRLRDALDEAAKRSSDPELAQRLTQAKYQWKNMKTVQPLVTRGVPGEISPLALNTRVNTQFPDRAFTGAGDLGDIADVAQQFMRQPRDSGTPIGTAILNRLVPAAAAGGASYWTGNDWLKSAGWGLAGLAGTAALARGGSSLLNNPAVLSGLIQRAPYLAPPIANRLRLTDQRQQQ